MKKKYGDKELLEGLKEVYEKYGYIAKNTINEFGKYGDFNYYRRFGSLENAMKLINIDTKENALKRNKDAFVDRKRKDFNGKSEKYTKQELIDYLNDYNNKIGYPKTREFDKNSNYPCSSTYRKVFGSFPNAIIEAGIEIPKSKKWLYERKQYTEKELLNHLNIETKNKLKHSLFLLTTEDIDEIKSMPSLSSYYSKFKSLQEAYLKLGINYNEFNESNLKKDMKEKYLEIKNTIERVPNSRDLDKFSKSNNKYYSSSTYISHFNSIHDMQVAMGDTPTNYSKEFTDNEMLEGLVKLKDELGIVPTQKDVRLCNYCGSETDYIRRFSSFVEAIKKAGMIPRSKKKPLITPKGNKAYSGYEYKFMLVLEQYNIEFKKEDLYKDYINNFDKGYRFDFIIKQNNNTYFIEIFGITGNENYDNKTKEKIQLCKDNNLKLIEFYPNDIGQNSFYEIYILLQEKIKNFK